MDYFTRTLSVLAPSLLATVLILAPAGFAHGQDTNDEDVSQQPDTSVPNIAGCWQGNAFNDSQGETGILFFFQQTGKKLSKKHSTIDLEPAVSTHGPIMGKVLRTKFRFRGQMSNGCGINGIGSFENDGTLSGTYHYSGAKCIDKGITGGEFSKVTFLGASCP